VAVEVRVPYAVPGPERPVPVRVPYPLEVIKETQVRVPKATLIPVFVNNEIRVPQPIPVEIMVEREVRVPIPGPVLPVPVEVLREVPFPVEVMFEVRVPKAVPVPVEVRVPKPVLVPVEVRYEVRIPRSVPIPVEVTKEVRVPVSVPKEVQIKVPEFVPVFVKQEVLVPQPFPVEVIIDQSKDTTILAHTFPIIKSCQSRCGEGPAGVPRNPNVRPGRRRLFGEAEGTEEIRLVAPLEAPLFDAATRQYINPDLERFTLVFNQAENGFTEPHLFLRSGLHDQQRLLCKLYG
jgi:hypothetical protein